MKKILILMICTILLCGCSSNQSTELTKMDEVKQIMQTEEYIIIDVRTKEEYEESHLVDAINIPYDEINESTVLDKNKTIIVYCRSGNRSSIAYNTLTNLGYTVYDLGAFSDIDLPKE